MIMLKLEALDCHDRRVVLRADYNVPMQEGRITDDQRLRASLPTLRHLLAQNASVVVMSHLGRPKPSDAQPYAKSLAPVAAYLSNALGMPVPLLTDWPHIAPGDSASALPQPGQIALAENVRYLAGEVEDDATLAQAMAAHCDVFVMDAFASAHRAHASTHGIIQQAPLACAGLLLSAECEALAQACDHPMRPVLTLVGGSKVSTKLHLLHKLLEKTQTLITGGGIANTLLAAKGIAMGSSLCEHDLLDEAKNILALAEKKGVALPLPVDARVVKDIAPDANVTLKAIEQLNDGDIMVDIGPETEALYDQHLQQAQTVIWNGPVGIFEMTPFAKGTQHLSETLAQHTGVTLAGGGDTVAAVNHFGVADQLTYVSTGGGAFLQYLEGTPLPSLVALDQK